MIDDVFDVIRGGATLVNSETQKWLTVQDVSGPIIIFIHGFTSHGQYLGQLADYVHAHGFATALFNYDSYRGIDVGANDLHARLEGVSAPLRQHGYALVAHSMGGLVALEHALGDSGLASSALRGIILLGVPTTGTLRDKRVITYMLDWADWLTGPNPYARNPASRAALQLTGNDKENFLTSLAKRLMRTAVPVPYLSISGGMNSLEFGKGRFSGTLRNRMLQSLIGNLPNNGLVPELSADLSRALALKVGEHCNNYSDYPRINHTFLTRNQQIASVIVSWLSTKAFLRTILELKSGEGASA